LGHKDRLGAPITLRLTEHQWQFLAICEDLTGKKPTNMIRFFLDGMEEAYENSVSCGTLEKDIATHKNRVAEDDLPVKIARAKRAVS
jgi:hypothetical protein